MVRSGVHVLVAQLEIGTTVPDPGRKVASTHCPASLTARLCHAVIADA